MYLNSGFVFVLHGYTSVVFKCTTGEATASSKPRKTSSAPSLKVAFSPRSQTGAGVVCKSGGVQPFFAEFRVSFSLMPSFPLAVSVWKTKLVEGGGQLLRYQNEGR